MPPTNLQRRIQQRAAILLCFVSTHDARSYTGFRAAALAFSAGRGFPGVPFVSADSGCIVAQLSPCGPCFLRMFHLSVWLAYEPFFQYLLGALYGPLPLLIVTFDIYRGILIERQSQILVMRPLRRPSSMAKLMSSSLFEHYLNYREESDSTSTNTSSSSAAMKLEKLPAQHPLEGSTCNKLGMQMCEVSR